MRPRFLAPLALALSAPLVASPLFAAQPFAIQSGDRVLIMGDTLLEREGSAAALESRMEAEGVVVRNLSFSADLPTGVSRASFDPAATGMVRVREQLALVKPTVAILGYGMAASLEQMTYASGDPNLNPDPGRYGGVFTPAKFKADLAALMEAIAASAEGKPVRFVLLAPLKHEDLRAQRPALPDPAAHNALLAEYTTVIRELAAEKGARFVDSAALLQGGGHEALTENGIHPSEQGLERWAEGVARELGWAAPQKARTKEQSAALRKAMQRKNELFFHRWRPANHTYIFGFRKREQGRNAVEIEQFDELIRGADEAIAALKAGQPVPALPVLPADPLSPEPMASPDFQLGDGLEIRLWAENPLLSKPIEINWDARGRLWVASSPIYPQIQPGAFATDKIFILEDTKHQGKADRTTVFSEDLLIPTGVAPELGAGPSQSAYVGASTELLLLTDTDGDGKADRRRVLLSGFGTEDTHHTIHALNWGPDGRLYFSQSIYIHSHMETPWGVVRLNSGGVLAYDPRSERVEVVARGLVNTWGNPFNPEGQLFLTDGAGGNGVSWGFPGAIFSPFEGASATAPSISAGGYPKFCSLALVRSPLFPADWQGNAITCDFRAHRMVRFSINDLAAQSPAKSGYATSDQPDVIRTPDQGFRPIDVKFGPDGALYVADWSNPVINHGEVDFRDPRRDKTHGRIWRIAGKGTQGVAWQALTERTTQQLLDGLLSKNLWEQEQSRRLLSQKLRSGGMEEVTEWQKRLGSAEAQREAAYVRSGALGAEAALRGFVPGDESGRALEARWLGAVERTPERLARLGALAEDASPRVRMEAMWSLARRVDLPAAELILKSASLAPEGDVYYGFSSARSIREVADLWLGKLVSGEWKWQGKEAQLRAGLLAIEPRRSGPAVSAVLRGMALPGDGSGPWLELIEHAGGVPEANLVWNLVSKPDQSAALVSRGLAVLRRVAERGAIPSEKPEAIAALLGHPDAGVVAKALWLAGAWKRQELAERLGGIAAGTHKKLGDAAVEGLAELGGEPAFAQAQKLLSANQPMELRRKALAILLKVRPKLAGETVQTLLKDSSSPADSLETWRVLVRLNPDLAEKVLGEIAAALSPEALKAGQEASQELGRKGARLTAAFGKLRNPAGAASAGSARTMQEWAKLVQEQGNALKGEQIYHSAAMVCVQCHAIGGAGGKLGPDMSTLGASAPLDYVIESVLVPSAKVKEGYHGVSYTLTDGGAVVGVPFEENATAIKVRLPGGIEMEVAKAKIKSSETIGSLMPAGLVDALPEADKLNLFAFLGSVGRPGAFDASNGGVTRAWKLLGSLDAAKNPEALKVAPAVFSLTDGRLLPEHVQVQLGMVPGSGPVFALTKLAVGTEGKVGFAVEGAAAVWLDGKSQSGAAFEANLGVGEHTLVVELQRGALPAVLRAKSAQVRFTAP
ncbi:MAG: hypothetical protein RLZZ244_3116 [Verrucomicrobiota bacterium]|jgi:putative heme-binding domain-containing protein